MVGKMPSVKADLAIYSQAVDIRGRCMNESLILGCNLDFSSCDIMVGFHKSIHIFVILCEGVEKCEENREIFRNKYLKKC